jgi:hypothetical protein
MIRPPDRPIRLSSALKIDLRISRANAKISEVLDLKRKKIITKTIDPASQYFRIQQRLRTTGTA